jgi:hypothetical protein
VTGKSAIYTVLMPPKADLQGTFLPVVNAHAIVIFFYLKKKGK